MQKALKKSRTTLHDIDREIARLDTLSVKDRVTLLRATDLLPDDEKEKRQDTILKRTPFTEDFLHALTDSIHAPEPGEEEYNPDAFLPGYSSARQRLRETGCAFNNLVRDNNLLSKENFLRLKDETKAFMFACLLYREHVQMEPMKELMEVYGI